MKELSDCHCDRSHSAGLYRGAIEDERSRQRLELESDEPFVAYTFRDAVEWGAGKKPDGVILAELEGVSWVCFIELKGVADEKAFLQLEGGALHFAPTGRAGGVRSHGDDHHDAWHSGDDTLEFMPSVVHRVAGIYITFRAIGQLPPQAPIQLAGKSFVRRAVQLTKRYPNHAQLSIRALFRKAALI